MRPNERNSTVQQRMLRIIETQLAMNCISAIRWARTIAMPLWTKKNIYSVKSNNRLQMNSKWRCQMHVRRAHTEAGAWRHATNAKIEYYFSIKICSHRMCRTRPYRARRSEKWNDQCAAYAYFQRHRNRVDATHVQNLSGEWIRMRFE